MTDRSAVPLAGWFVVGLLPGIFFDNVALGIIGGLVLGGIHSHRTRGGDGSDDE